MLWIFIAAGLILLGLAAAILYGTRVPGSSFAGPLEPLSEEEQRLSEELKAHVLKLAGEIGERNVENPAAYRAAADYIADSFQASGYAVTRQEYQTRDLTVQNLIAELPGASLPAEVVVIGAHYDSVFGTPGANDNASGVAALLALARRTRNLRLARTVRFVAFANEEPPFFQSGHMGSQVYAREAARRGEKIVAMLSLETIGCYSDRRDSQAYPFPFGWLYPDTGNFITFVSNFRSRPLLHRVVRRFRETAHFPSQAGAAPEWIPGIGWSDHWAFWKQGYPAVMVTDTAIFRDPRYHTPQDRPEFLDYARMARVVAGLLSVLEDLAGSP